MNQKTIFITGAASGIGRETSLFFARQGWFAGLFDVNEDGLQQLVSEIGSANCCSGIMDVTDPGSVRKGIDSFASKTGGRMDVLLNNAGILSFGLFEKVPLDIHLRIVDVNLKGCLTVIHFAISCLKQTPGARIINMSSASSIYGVPDLSVYSATKHALSAMTESLNIELERHGIFVCDIRPPYVKTPLLDSAAPVHSIRMMGVHLGPGKVARAVWKAAHGKKLHWDISTTWALNAFFHVMPFAGRLVVKALAMPSE